jgi:hypothetical protein
MQWTKSLAPTTVFALVITLIPPHAAALELWFLTGAQRDSLLGEISGDASYEHIRYTTQFHKPSGGSPGLMKVAEYFEAKAREYGLEKVRLMRQKSDEIPWEARSASLWMVEPETRLLADINQIPLRLADYSRSADVEAELVDVGAGLSDSDYQGKKVKGAIVLAHGSAPGVMEQAVWKRGALGLVCFPDPDGLDFPVNALGYPDQIRWMQLPEKGPGNQEPTFAFVLTEREGRALRARLQSSTRPIRVHAKVEAEYGGEPWMVMVEAFIRGTGIENQDVVLTGHLQEEKYSANDDGSGCANTLEIGRALAKLIHEGRLPRPRRNLRFWWTTEIGSERRYFADHPEEAGKILLNINQDMVGANQGLDVLRVQNVTQVPFSRSHYLTALAEHTIRYLVEANTPQLAIWQAHGISTPPRPIYAAMGTRQRYNAAVIPFHNNTDSMTFNEAPIGVPGITFTNWPDNYIHTSDDDLWNVDRTQLQRNAFAAAYLAFVAANATDESMPGLATLVYDSALTHLARDAAVAHHLVISATRGDLPEACRLARNQIRQGILREQRALETVAATGNAGSPQTRVGSDLCASLAGMEKSMTAELDSYITALHGSGVPESALSGTEKEMATQVPRLAAGPAVFEEKRGQVKRVDSLHDLMAFEVMNFVDGSRTALEVYEAVKAESLYAGEDYYGNVTPGKVEQYLQNLEQAGLIRFR